MRDDNYFYMNVWDPHTPHRTPEEYGNPLKMNLLYLIDNEIIEGNIIAMDRIVPTNAVPSFISLG